MVISATCRLTFSFALLLLCSLPIWSQDISLHAHNDYAKKKPLYDALEQEIYSIEIDVFPTSKGIVVAHTGNSLMQKPLLEDLYILPLKDLLANRKIPAQLSLVFDIKKGGNNTFLEVMQIVQKHLFPYRSHLRLLFTGDCNNMSRSTYKNWNILFDNSLYSYLKTGEIPDYTGRFSNSYSSFNSYEHKIHPDTIKSRLQLANMMGIETRLWAAPNNTNTWDKLIIKGFNTLNVDKYVMARNYINAKIK